MALTRDNDPWSHLLSGSRLTLPLYPYSFGDDAATTLL